jgi:hypothetical protein
VKLFTAIQHDARLLGHFLAHYRDAGITRFYIATQPCFRELTERFMSRFDITAFDNLDVNDTVLGGVSAVTELRRRYQRPDEWVVIVDLDEFVDFQSLVNAIECAERERANVVRAVMWDRFSTDGCERAVEPGSDLNKLFPVRARFIRDVMLGADFKGVFVKGQLQSKAAHHLFNDEAVASEVLNLSHYKWTAGALERLRRAHKIVLAAGYPFATEYARILDHYDRHGRFAWEEFGGELVNR